MKIKLLGNRADLTGRIGVVEFMNGLSTHDVGQRDADVIRANFPCEIIDGETTNERYKRMSQADFVPEVHKNSTSAVVAPEAEQAEEETVEATEEEAVTKYTADELGEIADKQGIAGLRDIAEGYGVRDKSIRGLIDGILEKQGS